PAGRRPPSGVLTDTRRPQPREGSAIRMRSAARQPRSRSIPPPGNFSSPHLRWWCDAHGQCHIAQPYFVSVCKDLRDVSAVACPQKGSTVPKGGVECTERRCRAALQEAQRCGPANTFFAGGTKHSDIFAAHSSSVANSRAPRLNNSRLILSGVTSRTFASQTWTSWRAATCSSLSTNVTFRRFAQLRSAFRNDASLCGLPRSAFDKSEPARYASCRLDANRSSPLKLARGK